MEETEAEAEVWRRGPPKGGRQLDERERGSKAGDAWTAAAAAAAAAELGLDGRTVMSSNLYRVSIPVTYPFS